jgi:hypothetical protein
MEVSQSSMAKARRPVSSEEKLRILREQDHWRKWENLDERRRCILCERTFTGHRVRIIFPRAGQMRLHCPTPDCPATPREWLHPGDPLTDNTVWHDWLVILDELGEAPDAPDDSTAGKRAKAYVE